MAVTCMWRVRCRLDTVINYVINPKKTISEELLREIYPDDLDSVLRYAANGEKTERRMYVSGVNLNPGIAYQEMTTVKRQYGKEDGILAWHGYMSFKPGEVTAAQAHEIGMEFAKKMWSDYQVLVATHLNTGVYHCHFVVNSVSYKTGKRIHDETSWFKFRHVADRLCLAHGLSEIETPRRHHLPDHIRNSPAANARYAAVRQAVDAAVAQSTNLEDLNRAIRKMGYNCNLSPNRKYWSVTPRGDGRASVRLYRLGDSYTNTAIRERLAENQKRTVVVSAARERNRTCSLFILRLKKYTGKKDRIMGLYWHYRYLLGNVQKNPGRSLYLPHRLKEDVARLKEISEEARFLSEEKIEALSDLKGLMEKYISELSDLEDHRRELRNELRRKGNEGRAPEIRAEIADVSALMEKDRKALKRCRNIEARSAQMFETVMQTEAQQEKIKESERSENGWTLEQTPPGRS